MLKTLFVKNISKIFIIQGMVQLNHFMKRTLWEWKQPQSCYRRKRQKYDKIDVKIRLKYVEKIDCNARNDITKKTLFNLYSIKD